LHSTGLAASRRQVAAYQFAIITASGHRSLDAHSVVDGATQFPLATDFPAPPSFPFRLLLVFLAASSSQIGCRYQGLRACRRKERRVNFCHHAGLIDSVVNFTRRFEERRTGRMHSHAAIAMSLR